MSRYKAAALHLAVSAVLGALVVAAMLLVWYPSPFFTAMGGNDLALQVAGASVLLGPFVTLIVFSATKRLALLRMDLAIIGAVQAALLAYAVYIVAEARPVYVVYAFDRFDIVAASDLREEELARVRRDEFRGIPWGAPRTVAVLRPVDPNEQLRVIMSSMAGVDLQTFPQYYVPYESEAAQAVKRSKSLTELRRRYPERAGYIDDVVAGLGRREGDTRYLPLRARARDYCALIDARSGAIVGFLDVDPW